MNNILIYSDLHINLSSLKECTNILEEIIILSNKYNCDTLINCGDTFDTLKPTSQELDVFAQFIKNLGFTKQHIIIAANSHESTTNEASILNHYGILSNNVNVVKEFKDENHLYCGHFSIKESNKNYDAKFSKEDLKDYLYVFLGHIHSYQLIKPNIMHLGSSRYVSFDESDDKQKIVALITDYGTEAEKVHFLALKTPYKMTQISISSKEDVDVLQSKKNVATQGKEAKKAFSLSECQTYLDKLDSQIKVKVKILDFESFRKFLSLCSKYSAKFATFKYSTEFNVISDLTPTRAKAEITTFKKSLLTWLEQQNINQNIKEILLKEINE